MEERSIRAGVEEEKQQPMAIRWTHERGRRSHGHVSHMDVETNRWNGTWRGFDIDMRRTMHVHVRRGHTAAVPMEWIVHVSVVA